MIARLSAIEIVRSRETDLVGRVKVAGHTLAYDVFGPFGTGYNIRVVGQAGTAVINYHWTDHPEIDVDTPTGRYVIADESIYDAERKKILELRGDVLSTTLTEALLLGIFAVNHHFMKKTGPFVR